METMTSSASGSSESLKTSGACVTPETCGSPPGPGKTEPIYGLENVRKKFRGVGRRSCTRSAMATSGMRGGRRLQETDHGLAYAPFQKFLIRLENFENRAVRKRRPGKVAQKVRCLDHERRRATVQNFGDVL